MGMSWLKFLCINQEPWKNDLASSTQTAGTGHQDFVMVGSHKVNILYQVHGNESWQICKKCFLKILKCLKGNNFLWYLISNTHQVYF